MPDTQRLNASTPQRLPWHRLRAAPAFWPLVALVALVLLNLLVTPNFGRTEIRAGRAFGSLVDILQNGSIVTWVQRPEKIQNPYFGKADLECGEELETAE